MRCRAEMRRAFTLIEIIIASGVLSLFMFGLFSLYGGGQKIGGQTLWAQRTINSLRFACRQISQNIKQSSYPTTIIYPGIIKVADNKNDFKLRYTSPSPLLAANCKSVTTAKTLGTYILEFPESIPEKQQSGGFNQPATIKYHIYSLSKEGELCYALYVESGIKTTGPDYIQSITRSTIPPPGAVRTKFSILCHDVQSVSISAKKVNAVSPISIIITCKYSRGSTIRSQKTVVVPNIKNLPHSSGTGSW